MTGPLFFNSAGILARERLVLAGGSRRRIPIAVRYGVWDHPEPGLTLIDTGYGPEVTQPPGGRLILRLYSFLLGPTLRPADAPSSVLARSGRLPSDVKTVILTHFHADHVARLKEFPEARIIGCGKGYARLRSLSRAGQLHQGFFRELMPEDFEDRFRGFETFPFSDYPLPGGCRALTEDGSLLAVPLPGHAIGHHGLFWPKLPVPLLYAADVQWLWQAIAEDRPPGYPARLVYADPETAKQSSDVVRSFARSGGAVVLCHDPDPGPYRMERVP
nr:MBL fold metallo-hydrolase [uncultured Gellertiella sp.]